MDKGASLGRESSGRPDCSNGMNAIRNVPVGLRNELTSVALYVRAWANNKAVNDLP